MARVLACAVLACALAGPLAIVPAVSLAATPHATVSVASEYLYRGLTRSRGAPSAQLAASVDTDSGWGAGLAAATVDMNPGRGATMEFSGYVSWRRELARDWVLAAQLARYEYPHDLAALPYDYTEGGVSLAWRRILTLYVGASPDYSFYSRRGIVRDRTAVYTQLALAWPVRPWLDVTAGYDRADLERLFGAKYDYWSAGLQGGRGRLTLALSYVDTSSSARDLFGNTAADGQWTVSAGWRLR